ncbi:MAG: hypothetical protein FWC26_04970 [Fibromonadales bacterium]|nr:hypothetical protein [Fibromonadales bacterium]
MKIAFSKLVFMAACVLALAFTTSCVPDGSGGNKTTATIAVDNRIVGKWKDDKNKADWIFNSDGTGSGNSDLLKGYAMNFARNFEYAFFLNKIIVRYLPRSYMFSEIPLEIYVYDYVFSPDGKTFIMYNSDGTAIWLTKEKPSH